MYDALQLVTKLILVAATLLAAAIVSLRIWRSDLDLPVLLSPRRMLDRSADTKVSWLPTREIDAIYQNGTIRGRVEGVTVDAGQKQIIFAEISKSGGLDLGAEFEFGKWRRRFRGADSLTSLNTSAPEKGQVIGGARCEIVGERSL